MRKVFTNLLALAVLCLLAIPAEAQIQTPAASPGAEFSTTVGLTDITLNYSRPSKKGRTIFAKDGLVPYGKLWRTGANAATKFTFGDDVKIGGKAMKAGSYAVLTIPSPEKWVVNLYPYESGNWGSYREKDPTVSISAVASTMDVEVETFFIDINDVAGNKANIYLVWDNTAVAIPLEVEVDKTVMASIERTMAGPSQNDYYQAATYLHESGKDQKKALEYIQKANAKDPKFWQVRREALILADMGMTSKAIEAAKKSKMLAEKAGNDDYVRMNEKSIAEWANK